jgi:predicted kinase
MSSMSPPLIHLVCGSTGAGKTTYARRLAEELGAVRFSIDEWMTALYWMDAPQPIDASWSMERVERCNALIWCSACEIARRGVACVLDLGLGSAQQRRRFLDLAFELGFAAQLHFIDLPAEERWRRVEARNQAGEGELPFAVTRDMFDFVESLFEAPDEEELWRAHGVRIVD